MESVLGYARTFFLGGEYYQTPLPDFQAKINRFHTTLEELAQLLDSSAPMNGITPERLLQGPFSDAMTHAGQLAMLRRLSNSPVEPENFIFADIHRENLSFQQPSPVKPGNRHGEWADKD